MKTIDEVLKRLNYVKSEEDLVDSVDDTRTRLRVFLLIQDFKLEIYPQSADLRIF